MTLRWKLSTLKINCRTDVHFIRNVMRTAIQPLPKSRSHATNIQIYPPFVWLLLLLVLWFAMTGEVEGTVSCIEKIQWPCWSVTICIHFNTLIDYSTNLTRNSFNRSSASDDYAGYRRQSSTFFIRTWTPTSSAVNTQWNNKYCLHEIGKHVKTSKDRMVIVKSSVSWFDHFLKSEPVREVLSLNMFLAIQ